MKFFLRIFLFFQIFVLSGLQNVIFCSPDFHANLNKKENSSISDENKNSEKDKDVNEGKEESNEESNDESNEDEFLHSSENHKLIEDRASAKRSSFYFSYFSPNLSFLSPPPELI